MYVKRAISSLKLINWPKWFENAAACIESLFIKSVDSNYQTISIVFCSTYSLVTICL